ATGLMAAYAEKCPLTRVSAASVRFAGLQSAAPCYGHLPTMLFDLLRAIFELGIPVAALSWLLFYRLYSRGDVARDADSKTIDAGLKEIKEAAKKSKEHSGSVVYTKWMKFGGGFYGVAALWTLLMIEASGIAGMVAHPSTIETMFQNG